MPLAIGSKSSQFLSGLPAIYQDNEFLSRFLFPFEAIFLAPPHEQAGMPQSLLSTLEGLTIFFDPLRVSEEFLPWLGQWIAVTLDGRLRTDKSRQFMTRAMHFYRWRGTKRNLEELLELFLDVQAQVSEPGVHDFQIGVQSTIGVDTYIGQTLAYVFYVKLLSRQRYQDGSLQHEKYLREQHDLARTIIELDKPAHTQYQVEFVPDPDEEKVKPSPVSERSD